MAQVRKPYGQWYRGELILPWRIFLMALVVSLVFLSMPTYSRQRPLTEAEGQRRVDSLYRSMESARNFKVRIAAANALAKIADGSVADWMLLAFRKEEHEAVRLAILLAIAAIPDHRILPPLFELVNQQILSSQELLTIERIVWNFRKAVALTAWAQALIDSPRSEERALAAYIVGLVGGRSALSALNPARKDPSPLVRRRAVQALKRFRSPPAIRARRINLKLNLRGLQRRRVTPELVRRYLLRNVNPRELDEAARQLFTKSTTKERAYRVIPIAVSPKVRNQTFRYTAEIQTRQSIKKVDLSRLKNRVRKSSPQVNQCYLDALKRNRKLSGDVQLQFLILGTGHVSTLEVVRHTLRDARVLQCIRGRVATIRFDPFPLKYVTMKYTYRFEPPKDIKYDFKSQRKMKPKKKSRGSRRTR